MPTSMDQRPTQAGGIPDGRIDLAFSMHLWIPAELVVDLAKQRLSRCLVLTWRISDKEPADLKEGPAIPEDAKWKFSG